MDELIGKYLAGEASAKELSIVEGWINERAENQKYFNDLKIIFERAGAVKEWQSFDTDSAWNKLKSRLKESNVKTVPLDKPRSISMYWRMAAAVVLILTVTYVIRQVTKEPVQTLAIQTKTTSLQDTLPDGSKAFLNKSSAITYEYNPRKKTRSVKLTGEAFFDVKHVEEKPFIIESEDVIIEDIGTTFNVKAYPDRETVEVFVETGEVAFYTTSNPGLHLKAGEMGVYDKHAKSFVRIEQADTNILAYKTRIFNFSNTDLGTVVQTLNEVYETKIQLREKLKSCRMSVSFKGESIESIAEIIAETFNLTMTSSGNEILLEGSGCEE